MDRKIIRSWDELDDEIERYDEWYFMAGEACAELRRATQRRDRNDLAAALDRWSELKRFVRPPLDIDSKMFETTPLRVVN